MVKKLSYFIFFIILVLAGFLFYQKFFNRPVAINLPPAQDYQNFVEPIKNVVDQTDQNSVINNTSSEPVVKDDPQVIKNQINLNVPFTSQAPTANWDQPWQDACEEASVLMVDYYYQNKKIPAKEVVENILLEMVNWQIEQWGSHDNLDLAKLGEYITATYNYRYEIIDNPSIALIKTYLNQGLPIIVPANGKKLANPNFRNGGPIYHMLVIKGYTADKFITNDPGTRLGADFIYTQENLMSAMADWDGNTNGSSGPKRILLLFKD